MPLHPTEGDVPFLERARGTADSRPARLEMLRTIGLAICGLVFMIVVIVVFALVLG